MTDESTVASKVKEAVRVATDLRSNDPVFREHTEYETYRLFREHLPAAYLEKESGGTWMFSRFADCKYILQNHELFSNEANRAAPIKWIPQMIDPPPQREYRRILDPIFSPAAMTALEPDIERYANELLDGLPAEGDCDFMAGFALPFPTVIFCRLMGFPHQDYAKLMRWQRLILHTTATAVAELEGLPVDPTTGRVSDANAMKVRLQASADVLAYLRGLVQERRTRPQDDFLTKLLAARCEGARELSDDEIEKICFLFFMAGLDTVAGVLGLTMETFAKQPDDRARFIEVMDDRKALDTAVEELVRYHSTVNVPRRVTRACPLQGVDLQPDTHLTVALIAANRDGRVFEHPDTLILDRTPNPHLGFAVGVHRCLGIHLARRELRIGLRAIHQRMPEYHITPGKSARLYTDGLRGLHSLPLTVGSRSA